MYTGYGHKQNEEPVSLENYCSNEMKKDRHFDEVTYKTREVSYIFG